MIRWKMVVAMSALLCGVVLTGCGEEGSGNTEDALTADTASAEDSLAETSSGCADDSECVEAGAPLCNLETGVCEALPAGHPIGWGDGSSGSVGFTTIYEPPRAMEAVDIEFNPVRPDELWVQLREFESEQPCTSTNQTFFGCVALEGSVAIVTRPGTPESSAVEKKDEGAWHFMRRPPALAFGPNDTFATCGEYATGNFPDEPEEFIGPTLWSSNPDVFAITPPGGNGSHLDMLHLTPFCVGIAHEQDNVYWVINGKLGALDRYDFKSDHGPGAADHSDGETYRYAEGAVTRVPGVPGHAVYHGGLVYVADTGGSRVVRFDPSGATEGIGITPIYEDQAVAVNMEGGTLTELIPPLGRLIRPSGLHIHDEVLYVTDNSTGRIHAYELDGTWIRSLQTELPEGALAGFTTGPEGEAYFTDLTTGEVTRIDP